EATNYPTSSPMGVQPYVNTGNYTGFCSNYTNVKGIGGWQEYILDMSTCAGMSADASMVIAAGVSFHTGSGQLSGDAGVNPTKPVSATIHVDSFWLEGSCGSTDGGAGAGGATGGAGGATGGSGGSAGATGGAGGSAGATGGSAAGGTGGS